MGFFFFWEALWALHDMITLSTHFISWWFRTFAHFYSSILQFSKWTYNDMTYKIIKKTCHNFLAALQAKFNLIYVENHLYEVPLLYFSQLFRSQPLLETEKAVIMGKTVSSTADILCCLSDPGIDKPVVCICDVCMHVLIK